MTTLENITDGAFVRGIVPDQAVQVVRVDWIGNLAINVAYREQNGIISEATLYRDDETRLSLDAEGRHWSLAADGGLLRLVTEACRIDLAHHFDPYLAIHTSLVEPLPHQISAVYGEMLSRQPLRFLLADDPGAGKTIMAGLFIKELIARSDLERCLVVAPGNLVEQWQDELNDKFDLKFDILSGDMIRASRSGSFFDDHNQLIVRLDMLARRQDLQEKLKSSREWDFIICDEAHRMSATYSGGEIKYTKRYQLGQKLSPICRHLLLMTATPHNGKEEDFQLFMALIDSDRFEGRFRDGVHYADITDMMRRLTKEELSKFDGRPLFPERRAYTVKYKLSALEAILYDKVTNYVREEMNRIRRFFAQDGRKRNTVGFALQILQRRLASSPAAIYQSLERRHDRLKKQLEKMRFQVGNSQFGEEVSSDTLEDFEEYGQEQADEIEEMALTGATAAETLKQLTIEVATLEKLKQMAFEVLQAGQDTKWRELSRILDDELMTDPNGNRRKLIIFTEPKDTLNYLCDKIRARFGKPEAVDVIHGGVRREERRKIIERFMQDRDLLVLVANDAAGEGVNLQRGHLMVNYDLPWNPNRIEQRFGRIHRIGQTEVCHLWNLVAADTREGEVYSRLLTKLETARETLGGKVYDVLGELFESTPLRDLLFEAVQYGEQEEVKARLFQQVDGAFDQDHLWELLKRRALTNDTMPPERVQELRLKMERARAQRLQPHHVQSFFVKAFEHLGGRLRRREEGRWEITYVPSSIRERDGRIRSGTHIQEKYERICFDKAHVNQQPVAAFVCPGHPLLEVIVSMVRENYEPLMKQGAIMVDEADAGEDLSVIFLFEHSVRDGLNTSAGNPHIISRKLQFTGINRRGETIDAGIAPHLNLRPAEHEEIELVQDLLDEGWLTAELEKTAVEFATIEMAQSHVTEIRNRRLPEIDKVEQEVRSRLEQEIRHWDAQAFKLREQEKAGGNTRLNRQNAERRVEELSERLRRRMQTLKQERHITSQPLQARGGLVVIPQGLLFKRSQPQDPEFAQAALARRRIELAAMEAVIDAERRLGNDPRDISAEKAGYDIDSYDPDSQRCRFIEVKGRVDGADTVMVTRNEVITSLNEPEKYILAIVEVGENGHARSPRYVRGRLAEHEPGFGQTAIQFSLKSLLERAEAPS